MLFGAGGVTRTPDLLITNQLLYQLSYTSLLTFCGTPLSLSLATISDLLITKCIGALHLTVFRDFGAFPLGILREVRPILSIVFARSFPRVGHGVGQATFRARTREAPPCKKSNKIGKKCCKLESYKSCLSCVRIDTFCTAVVNKSYSMEIACSDFNGNYLSFFAKFLGLQASVAVIDDLS